ncbi:MAG: hypothetical protein ACOCWV_05295, partial [Planctomycetota bacterium]
MRTNVIVWILLGLTLAAIVLPAAPAVAQDTPKVEDVVTVVVTGSGTDKEEAVRDAKRKACEKGAGTFIYSQSKVKDFVLIKDTILTRSNGFVQKFTILNTDEEDGIVTVKAKVVVSVKGLADAWGVVKNLLSEMGRPKVMVYVSEKIDKENQDSSRVQTQVEKLLLKNGFLLVDKKQIKAIDEKAMEAALLENKPQKVQAIARRYGAQLFITGAANARLGQTKTVYGVKLHLYGATTELRCFRTDTAQMLSSQSASGSGSDRMPLNSAKKALSQTGEKIGPSIQYDILKFWQDVLEGKGEVQLEISGGNFMVFRKAKKALPDVKGVKEVSGKFHAKTAMFSIEADCKAEVLAERIMDAMDWVEITDVSQNVI